MQDFASNGSRFSKLLRELRLHDHLCLIYETRAEQFAAVIPFLRSGLESKERCVYVVDENTAFDVLAALEKDGIDVDRAQREGALRLLTKHDTYLREGYFDPDRMIQLLRDETKRAQADGFRGIRVTGEMTWMLGGAPGSSRLIEYEAKLNHFFHESEALAICQYNRKRFSPEILVDVLRTHPIVICGGSVCRNLYYVPPDEFLGHNPAELEVDRLLRNIQAQERADWRVRQLESAMESSQDGILLQSLEGTILDWNRGAERLYGYTADEVRGQPVTGLVPQERIHEMLQTCEKILHGDYVENFETVHRHKSGAPVDVSVTVSAIRDSNGEIMGLSMIARDVAARRKAEAELRRTVAELERSNAELERFAYIASHDLQEPLRVITSFLQLLEQRCRGQLGSDANEFIRFAVDASNRMKALISDLLAYSRLGTRSGAFEAVSLDRIMDQVVQNLQLAINETLALVTADPLPTVNGDPVQLMQLLQNLVGNGLKFTREQPPRIHVRAQRRAAEWVLSVSDNGLGIDPRYFDRIFVIFQRLHSAQEYPGTGIGLAISKRIVERHGGRIWVESAVGQGSTFYLSLPSLSPAGASPL